MRNLKAILLCGLFSALSGALFAAPQLRLSVSTVGPLFVTAGQNGPAQVLDAGNIGDGTLSLAATSNVSWITPTVGATRNCDIAGTCRAIGLALTTSSLTRGSYTGIVTLSDPNAIDAPQTVTVTVQIGSGVPDTLDLYLPPNSSVQTSFTSNSTLSTAVTSPGNGTSLAVSALGGGSFSFTYTYLVTAAAAAGTPDNDYRGSINVTGSTQTADNKSVPVVVHVTSQPIAAPSPTKVSFKIAQGAAKVDKWVVFGNSGLGNLTLTSATGNATWLTAKIQANLAVLTADPAGQSPGTYTATVTVNSNAKNGPTTVPVTLEVVASSAPVTQYRGVVDNALFAVGDPVSQGGIVAVFGDQFTTGTAASAQSLPLGTSMGGATVFINDNPVPVYYVSASHVLNATGQINFQIPYSTTAGQARVRVDRDGQRGNTISVQVAPAVPRLLRLNIGDYPIAVFSDNVTFPMPVTPGIPSRPAKIGDALTFYSLGFGQTNPPVTEGKAAPGAEPLARIKTPKVVFGQTLPGTGVATDPFYAGLTPFFVGLYQINVFVPQGTPLGSTVPVYVDMGGGVTSNRVAIAVQ